MLKRLKRKFLTMTMGLISLVLIVVFVSLLISTYTQQRRQIDMSLNQALGWKLPKSASAAAMIRAAIS